MIELLLLAYRRYMKEMFQINNDIFFWDIQFKQMVDDFVSNDIDASRRAYTAGFYVFDLGSSKHQGSLKGLNMEFHKNIEDMRDWYKEYYLRTVNLYISKAYNEMELILVEAIQIVYFPGLHSDQKDRKYYNDVKNGIKDFLKLNGGFETKNNRHIIQFLRIKNKEFELFSDQIPRTNLNHTWLDFFEFLSLIRNVGIHYRSVITTDELNNLKSNYSAFLNFFSILVNVEKDTFEYIPQNENNLWGVINDFTANTVKFLAGEKNMDFLL